jgi:hypothetical protein
MYKKNLLDFEYSENALLEAIILNDIPLIKWWIKHSDEFELKYDFSNVQWHVLSINTIKFLYEEQDVIKMIIPHNIMQMLFWNSDKVTLDFWYDLLIKNNIEPFPESLKFNEILSLEILEWLYQKHQLGLLKLHYNLNIFFENIDWQGYKVIQWWFSHADEFNIQQIILEEKDYKVIEYFARTSTNIISYLYFEQKIIRMQLYPQLIDELCRDRNFDLLNLFYNNRDTYDFTYTNDSIDLCQDIGIYEWFYQKRNELELKYTKKCFDTLCIKNKEKHLKWWFDHRSELEIKFTEDKLRQYISKDSNRDYLSELLS